MQAIKIFLTDKIFMTANLKINFSFFIASLLPKAQFYGIICTCQAPDNGPVVQLVRMPPCHGGGRGFESHPGRHLRK